MVDDVFPSLLEYVNQGKLNTRKQKLQLGWRSGWSKQRTTRTTVSHYSTNYFALCRAQCKKWNNAKHARHLVSIKKYMDKFQQ